MEKAAVAREAGYPRLFVGLAFAFSWTCWLMTLQARAPERFLNIGTAGPAVAAVVLVAWRWRPGPKRTVARSAVFLAVWLGAWLLLRLQYDGAGRTALSQDARIGLLLPACVPAWVMSQVASRNEEGRGLIERMTRRPDRWSLLGLVLFPAILLPGALLARALDLPLAYPENYARSREALGAAAALWLFNLMFVAVPQEPGWRGSLLDGLEQRWSPLAASVMVWLPWALWYGPLDYFGPEHMSLRMWAEMRVGLLLPIAVVMTWLYNRSGRSLQATALLHATMITLPVVVPTFRPGLALVFAVAGWMVWKDKMWRRPVYVAKQGGAGERRRRAR